MSWNTGMLRVAWSCCPPPSKSFGGGGSSRPRAEDLEARCGNCQFQVAGPNVSFPARREWHHPVVFIQIADQIAHCPLTQRRAGVFLYHFFQGRQHFVRAFLGAKQRMQRLQPQFLFFAQLAKGGPGKIVINLDAFPVDFRDFHVNGRNGRDGNFGRSMSISGR